MSKRELVQQLKQKIDAMPKCPTCGGFALPAYTPPHDDFICKDHGRFTPERAR